MRWAEFLRVRVGARVRWLPTNEKGVVRARKNREVWVQWASGRVEKLHVEEDAFDLVLDPSNPLREVSEVELQRRRAIAGLRPPDHEDGSPAELERVWREAAEQRASRACPAKLIRPSRIPIGAERRAER